jgi:hypothetical protein
MTSCQYAIVALFFAAMLSCAPAGSQKPKGTPSGDSIDLAGAEIVVSDDAPSHAKYADLLQSEIQKRTGLSLERKSGLPANDTPAIVLGNIDRMPSGAVPMPAGLAVPENAEGYAIWVDHTSRSAPTIYLMGRDDRGVLFAAGRLLRLLRMKRDELTLDGNVQIATSPRYPVRGHELGYRNVSNTYDAWELDRYEQYIRDLAIFGANSVQLLFDSDMSPKAGAHMTESSWDRLPKLSELVSSYGLDVWLWLALSDEAISAEEMEAALELRRTMFERMPRIDVVFVPGGDPGGTHPEVLLPWMARLAEALAEYHPNAQLWLSNEAMEHEWNDYLFDYLQKNQPEWLDGIVFGTWVKMTLEEERERTPERYSIVRYADITHCIECQYPVPDWDQAYAFTLGREPINPRPVGTAHIHNLLAPLSSGFITYSDGVNDDVNKFVWTAMGWDPDADLDAVLTEYGRYFIGEDYGEAVAQGLLALERNWQGPLLENDGVEKTLEHWQAIEKTADAGNWRLQSALYRAYYDAYIQQRLMAETHREEAARTELERASTVGVAPAIEAAQRAFADEDAPPVAPELRSGIEALAGDLFRSIGMQLSVEKYGANHWERGATLDGLDRTLSNRRWFETIFEEILAEENEDARLALLNDALHWEDPGPGGYYDDLGNSSRQPHLVRQKTWLEDPGFVESPQNECNAIKEHETWRLSWLNQGQTLFGTPLKMRYEGLDPKAAYRLRVVYAGRFRPTMQLTANGRFTIHEPLPQPEQPERLEFEIPQEATQDGTLELEWRNTTGRGCQVAEVWLVREPGS